MICFIFGPLCLLRIRAMKHQSKFRINSVEQSHNQKTVYLDMTHLSSLHSLHCHTLPAFWNITSRKIQLVANTWESPFYGTRPQMYPELISTAQNSMYATIFFCTSTSRYALITPSHVFVDIDADGLMFWIEVIGVVVVVFVEEIPAATAGFPIEVVGVVVGVFVEEVAATTAGTIDNRQEW